MMLIGQRGTGKTALLLEFAERAQKKNYITAKVTANAQLLSDILQVIQSQGAKFVKGKKSISEVNTEVNIKGIGFSLGLTFNEETEKNYGFRIKLSLLLDKLSKYNKGVLLLVDEVQSSSDSIRELATTYQHLIGEEKNIAIVMAGLPSALSSVLNDKILTFLNRAKQIKMNPIPISEVRQFYQESFENNKQEISDKALEKAAKATQGFPYLLQLIGYQIERNCAGLKVISDQCVQSAIKEAKAALADSVFKPCLNPLSNQDIAFLQAMAKDKTYSCVDDIATRLKVNQGYVQMYRKRLLDAGVIAAPRRGIMTIIIPYLNEYLLQENFDLATF